MRDIREAFPDLDFALYETPSYAELVASMGVTILVQRDIDDSYSGDSLMLLRDDADPRRHGVLVFGWGSCPGCDALQAASDYDALAALRDDLAAAVVWGDAAETMTYLREHDWAADFIWSTDPKDVALFIAEALAVLG